MMIAEQQAAKASNGIETDIDWTSTGFVLPNLPAATVGPTEDLDLEQHNEHVSNELLGRLFGESLTAIDDDTQLAHLLAGIDNSVSNPESTASAAPDESSGSEQRKSDEPELKRENEQLRAKLSEMERHFTALREDEHFRQSVQAFRLSKGSGKGKGGTNEPEFRAELGGSAVVFFCC